MQTYATMASRLSHFEPSFSVEKGFFTLTSASMCVCIGMRAAAAAGERAAYAQVKELYLWSYKFYIKH